MRLIDADALKKTIKNMPNDYYGDLCIGDALKEINNAPTIDAVPVVRCGECKYNTSEKKCLYPDSIIKIPDDNDFCSYGERKESEGST